MTDNNLQQSCALTSKTVTILPCPFCGSPAREQHNWPAHYGCNDVNCGAYHAALSLKEWNTRPAHETDGWRPIETAPKHNCTVITLAWNPDDWTTGDGFYFKGEWIATGFFHSEERACEVKGPAHQIREWKCEPKYWRPRAKFPSSPLEPTGTYTNEAPAHPPIMPERFNSTSTPEKASEPPPVDNDHVAYGCEKFDV